jgi:hypothetical protein
MNDDTTPEQECDATAPAVTLPTPATPEPLSPAERELAEIRAAAREAGVDEREYLVRKEAASDAKKTWEAALTRLQRLCLATQEELPLFDRPADAVVEPEPWRSHPVAELGLPDGIVTALEEAGLATVGAMADYTEDHQITDVLGIGQAKADKIDEALLVFWATHPVESTDGVVVTSPPVAVSSDQCTACDGTGADLDTLNGVCLACNGTGTIGGDEANGPEPTPEPAPPEGGKKRRQRGAKASTGVRTSNLPPEPEEVPC